MLRQTFAKSRLTHQLPHPRLALALALFALLAGLAGGRVQAGKAFTAASALTLFTVNSLGDDADATPGDAACATAGGVCTLRAALEEANTTVAPLTINFSVTGTLNLAAELPNLAHPNLTITGPGANLLDVRRNAASQFRIFTIDGGSTVTLSGLTVSNGDHPIQAGGIQNSGTLTMTDCVVRDNRAGQAGGLQNDGVLTMTGCTVSGNDASPLDGGGLTVYGASTTLTNCTFSGNQTAGFGGGLAIASGLLHMTNCTVTNNTAYSGGGLYIDQNPVSATLKNILMAGNSATEGTAHNLFTQLNFQPGSVNNLIGAGDSGGLTNGVAGNQLNVPAADVLLAPLANNGGPAPTHLPRCGSPAINAGTAGGAPGTDQRGLARVGNVDIGAVEAQPQALTLSPATLPDGVQGMLYAQPLTAAPAGGNYTFAVTTNSLPPGLTLTSNGLLSGTPSGPGNYTFVLTATASGGLCAGTRAYNLLITGTCATITVNPAALAGGASGTPYSQTVSATGGLAPYSFSVKGGALPPGLTLDAETGVISGTPTAGGTFTPTIRATGQGGCTGQRLYVISVTCAAVTINPATLPVALAGVAYSQHLTANVAGTFSLLLGSLPPGFTLSSTGLLSGSVKQSGSYHFTVRVTAGTCSGTRAYTLIVTKAGATLMCAALAQTADYDGDGQSDLALWANGVWHIRNAAQPQGQAANWGAAGDLSLMGDYDGDGRSDLAVWRPATGAWLIQHSSDGGTLSKAWGGAGDVPMPGDYDGDGQTDLAVWRPSEGNWYVIRSSDQQYAVTAWGAGYAPYDDVPVAGDYDGDGKTDLAVFRRATGTWLVKRSSDGQFLVKAWGLGSDVPVPNDYDGDGKTDMAVWRSGVWYVWQSATNRARVTEWGANNAPYFDQAALGDYDGDGQADVAVWRVSAQTWYIRRSADGSIMTQPQGQTGDAPVSARRQ